MTQKQLIDQFCEFRGKCTTDDVVALNFAYEMLAPRWISVDDELPKEHEWILGFSLKRSYIDVYNFDSNGLIEAHGITHWMHLSPPPIITRSKKGGER